jgi:N utilization substance protein A
VDPVGACVGVKGQRVQAIVRELGGERIDIVPWSADPVVFVSRALSPAKVVSAGLRERERRIVVIVADDQLSLAIGKGGQNARLAAKLTGFKIDLVSESDKASREEEERALRIEVRSAPHIGPKLAERLEEAGICTLNELVETPLEVLQAIPGVGGATAVKLIELASSAIESAASRYAAVRSEREEAARAAQAEADDGSVPVEESGGPETAAVTGERAAGEAWNGEETREEPGAPSGEQPDGSAEPEGADR